MSILIKVNWKFYNVVFFCDENRKNKENTTFDQDKKILIEKKSVLKAICCSDGVETSRLCSNIIS